LASLADLHIAFNYELTPVRFAAYEGHIEMVRLLAEIAGATMTDDLLIFAADGGRVEIVEMLLMEVQNEHGAYVPAKGIDRATALHRAAEQGHGDVVALLLGRMEDADVAAKEDIYGGTALHGAASNGHGDVVALLLGRMEGADVAAKDGIYGETALHRAAEQGHGDVVALLERALEKESTSRIRGNTNEDHQVSE
jgi:ankyrin repeat protein